MKENDMMEALKEKNVAAIMMDNKDYSIAREKLLKARELYPALDNVDSMLLVCEVLILVAGIKLSELETDNYFTLQLLVPNETYSDASLCYQKLLSLLQPIRGVVPGSELALEFLQKAFPKLSEQQKHSQCEMTSSSQLLGNGVSKEVISERSRNSGPAHHETEKKDGTITHQATSSENDLLVSEKTVAFKKPDQEFYNFENNRKPKLFKTGQIWAARFQANLPRNHRYARISSSNGDEELSVTWLKPVPNSSSETTWYFAGLPVGCGSFDLNEGTKDTVRPTDFSHKCSRASAVRERFKIYPRKGEIWALYKNWNPDEWASNPKSFKGCKFQLVEMLSDFSELSGADVVDLIKVDGFKSVFQRQTMDQSHYQISSEKLYMFSHNIPAHRLMGGDSDRAVNAIFELDQLALPGFTKVKKVPSLESCAQSEFLNLMYSPNDFATGEIWAVYNGKDIMPRQYVQIEDKISENQVFVTILEPHPVHEHEIEWRKRNLPISCGMFEPTGISVNLNMSQFSHLIHCHRLPTKPQYLIYPKKGEVWAMYKSWNHNWEQSDYTNCHYLVVEIVSELSDENGIKIARLVEVENCLTFFRRKKYNGCDITGVIPQEKMRSFSHRISAFKVDGIGTYSIPEDSWQLDSNALHLGNKAC